MIETPNKITISSRFKIKIKVSFNFNFFDTLIRINKKAQKTYMEKFIKFSTKRLSIRKPKLSKFIPINVGIEVNRPVKNTKFENITLFKFSNLKISFLYE